MDGPPKCANCGSEASKRARVAEENGTVGGEMRDLYLPYLCRECQVRTLSVMHRVSKYLVY